MLKKVMDMAIEIAFFDRVQDNEICKTTFRLLSLCFECLINALCVHVKRNYNVRGCFTKTKIDFKLDLTMAGRSCHCCSHHLLAWVSKDVQTVVTNLQNCHLLIVLFRRKIYYLKIVIIKRQMVNAISGMNSLP